MVGTWDVVVMAQFDVLFLHKRELEKLSYAQRLALLEEEVIVTEHMQLKGGWAEGSVWREAGDHAWSVVSMYLGPDRLWFQREGMY